MSSVRRSANDNRPANSWVNSPTREESGPVKTVREQIQNVIQALRSGLPEPGWIAIYGMKGTDLETAAELMSLGGNRLPKAFYLSGLRQMSLKDGTPLFISWSPTKPFGLVLGKER